MYNLNNINSFSANVDEIFHLIETSKKILIATHENPEGDAISSAMSLGMFLKSLDKEIYLYDKDPIPLNLRFLPWSKEFSQKFPAEPIDLLIVVDCGELQRVGDGYENLLTINRIINIDHHFTNNNFGHANLVIPDASSTGEVLFYLFAAYGAKENKIEYKIGDELPCKTEERQKVLSKINKDIAICLYASILTDTGSFRYASATKNAFYIASVLNQYDINPAKIAEEIYETKPQEQYRLLAKSLATLELVQDGKIASMIGSKQMLNEVFENNENQQKGMALFENFVNYPRSINGVEIAIFFKEASFNEYRLSFRAKSYANVAKVAEKYGGGGHKFAAGCKVSGDLNNIKMDIYEYCREVL
ncbi:MAG: bifunctional oligoribonuclease/PAP phosphatase NrnA [Deltaproteobacteria bacterium]|jgi:phosphoesterase RecJ-like protein|nr:bifunctional oligoribonuclease/PAP phosphatase NrnA [Deltaproteobacteria bacterium]